MNKQIKPAIMLAAVCALALLPLTSANAGPKVQERGEATFTFVFEAPAGLEGTIEGWFAVEGAVKDSGGATEDYAIAPDLSVTGKKTLVGRRGTIEMVFTAQLSPDLLSGDAQWEITDGTGAYKKIRGSGEGSIWIELADGTLRGEYTGSITKDPSLK